jgi:polyphosphate kinase 2
MLKQKIRYTKHLPELLLPPKKVFKKNGKLKRKFYEEHMLELHLELVKLQKWLIENKKRLLCIFEGIDTAGKSSTIKELNSYLNPRKTWTIALPKPSDVELTQWYFQRHLKHLPNGEEWVFFDRSWYNRAGVEKVFGFCTKEQFELFYHQVNDVERMLAEDGIMLFKFYYSISKKTQAKRIKERKKNPLKSWKLSKLDYESLKNYDKFIKLRDKMFQDAALVPWAEFDANDKKRARLNTARFLLDNIDYEEKNKDLILGVDKSIVKLHKSQK